MGRTWKALSFSRIILFIELLSKNNKRQFYQNIWISFSLNLCISVSKSYLSVNDSNGASFGSVMLSGVKNRIGDIDVPTYRNHDKYRPNSFQKPYNLLTIFIEFWCYCHIACFSRKLAQTFLFQSHWPCYQQQRQSHTSAKWHQVSYCHASPRNK